MNNTFKMLSVLIALFNYSFCTINAHNNEDITVNDIYAFRDGEETDDDETTFHGIDAIYNALESINDNSYNNRYIIHIDGHFIFNDVSHHVKLMRSTDNYNTWFVNVYGKDYVTLDGGNKDNTSVEMYLDLNTEFPYWSDGIHRYYGGNYHVIFNNARWFECRNITFIGRNTRYALHQEDFNKYDPSYALFENCDFIFNYDRIWTRENVIIPEDQTIMGGNTVLGCGYRNGGDITFRNCLIKGGVGANTLLIGSHTGFFISENFNYIPADIKFDNCIMEGGDRLLGYSSMGWQVQDVFHFNDCLFNTDAYISLNVSSYILNDNPLSCPLAVFKDNSPMPVARHKSDGSNVLKISALNVETSRIRLVKECTAQEIFADRNNHSNNKTMTEWGAYKSDNTIYKDDDFGCDGYLLGTNSINKNTLGKRLGDCSINNKTFSFTINDTLYSFTFKEDMTNLTNSEVINMLNEAFDGKAVFSVTPLSYYFFPKFDNVYLMQNMSEKTALRGMGVTISDNRGFKLAKTNDKLHGIVIDDTPAGQYGRIALSGKFFSMEKGVGLLFEDGRTNYGSKRCSFEISPRQDGMFVKVDYDENADQLLQWIDANHVELIQSYNLPIVGDINCDGFINIEDLSTLVAIIMGKRSHTFVADIDRNDMINIADLSLLINLILGK